MQKRRHAHFTFDCLFQSPPSIAFCGRSTNKNERTNERTHDKKTFSNRSSLTSLGQKILLAYETLVGHVEFVAGVELLVTHEARETVDVENAIAGLAHQVGGHDDLVAARTTRTEAAERTENKSLASNPAIFPSARFNCSRAWTALKLHRFVGSSNTATVGWFASR